MSNQARSFPFRWVLPITQLLVCAVVLWPLRSDFVTEIGASIDEYRGHPRVFKFKASPEQEQLLERYEKQHPLSAEDRLLFRLPLEDKHAAQVRQRRLDIAKVLNFPGGLVNLPYAIWGPTRIDWTPKGMDLDLWRALNWPLMCIGFWWIAGRGIEALLAARRGLIYPRIRWIETFLALLPCISGVMLSIIAVVVGRAENDSVWVIAFAAGALWTLLGAVIITARLWQWRIKVRLSQSLIIRQAPGGGNTAL